MEKFALSLFALLVVSSISLIPAFGHGFGYEVLPPVIIGNREATLSLSVSPLTFDPDNKEYEMTINLSDSKTQAIIENVTYLIEIIKDDKIIFKSKFHDDLGNLYLKIFQKDSDQVKITGKYDEGLGWMKKDGFNPIQLEGPIFSSGGLYEFNIQILTVDKDDNVLEKPVTLNAAVSIAEKTSYEVTAEDGSKKTLGLTSYYDRVNNFQYFTDLQKIYFSMPFDWTDKVLDQISIVHEEIHIPKTFLDMMTTDYDISVNGVPLPDASIQVDDYSYENDRIVHVVIAKEQLFGIRDSLNQALSDIEFTASPAKEVKLPLSAYANAQYQIDLWWEPQTISANKDIIFYVDLRELYKITKEQSPISFDFVLLKNNEESFRKNIESQLNGPPKNTSIEYQFSNDQTGLITVSIQNIGENEFAKNQFNIVVNPQEISSKVFPIRLVSMKSLNDESDSGKYYVDLTWFPSDLRINDSSEFVITIYDKTTGIPIPEAEYDFVLLQNGDEIYRTSGFAKAGGSFENYMFSEKEIGDAILRIENIDNSGQFVEIPIAVTPEFPLGAAMIFPILFSFIIIMQKFYFGKKTKLE